MKKIYILIALVWLGMTAMAQSNQTIWVDGEVLYKEPIHNADKMAYDMSNVLLSDTLHLIMPQAVRQHDTVRIVETTQLVLHDTTVIVKDSVRYVELCVPGVAVNSKFPVSANKKVSFVKGNLQYQPATDTWRFAENQYDNIGIDNQNTSASYYGWIDLFGWGTGNNPLLKSNNYPDYSTFVDWGTNPIGGDQPNTWRTLTTDEWYYLITHTRWGIARVNGIAGLVLIPDGFSIADFRFSDDTELKLTCVCNRDCNYTPEQIRMGLFDSDAFAEAVYTSEQWAELESKGFVFFPAAGKRQSGGSIDMCGEYGYYWLASEVSDYSAWLFSFGVINNHASISEDNRQVSNREYGFSVRLVKDVE